MLKVKVNITLFLSYIDFFLQNYYNKTSDFFCVQKYARKK